MELTTARRCKATTKSGQPCRAVCLNGSDYCFWHDPDKAKERAEARRKGGQARHGRKLGTETLAGKLNNLVEIRSVDDALALLERATLLSLALENSNARNRVLVAIATAAIKALKVGELEERIAALEARG